MANKNFEFGLCCTPATMVDTQELGATEILISYGGGMGGANQTIYALDYKLDKDNSLYNIEVLDGTTTKINKDFIVKIQDKTIIRTETDVRKRSDGFKTIVNYYAIDKNDTYHIATKSYVNDMKSILTILR